MKITDQFANKKENQIILLCTAIVFHFFCERFGLNTLKQNH